MTYLLPGKNDPIELIRLKELYKNPDHFSNQETKETVARFLDWFSDYKQLSTALYEYASDTIFSNATADSMRMLDAAVQDVKDFIDPLDEIQKLKIS